MNNWLVIHYHRLDLEPTVCGGRDKTIAPSRQASHSLAASFQNPFAIGCEENL
jgi:hypothetical protein